MKDFTVSVSSAKVWLCLENLLQNTLRLKKIVKNWLFGLIINVAVFVQIILLGITTYSKINHEAIDILGDILLYFFVAVAIIKIIGLGPKMYFRDNWNTLDFFLAIFSFLIETGLSFLKVIKNLKFLKGLKLVKISNLQ
jgi:tellurite resistance protein TehA-like permease